MPTVHELVSRNPPMDVVIIPPEMLLLPGREAAAPEPILNRIAFMDARVRSHVGICGTEWY